MSRQIHRSTRAKSRDRSAARFASAESRAAGLIFLAILLSVPALAMGPFEKNHPLVDEGTTAYDSGDYDKALEKFDAAGKERPTDPRVHYNRGLALHKLNRNPEAREALAHAEELDRKGELTNKIHYNLGNVAAAENNREEAIREYRKALRADPNDELARHNLEVLLRDLPPKEQQGRDGGTPDGGKSDGGRPDAGPDGGASPDGGSDGGKPDGGQQDGGEKDGGPDDGGAGDGGTDGGADGGQGDGGQGDGGKGDGGEGQQEKQGDGGEGEQGKPDDAGADGGADQKDGGAEEEQSSGDLADGGARLSKKDAEKLLDSFKSNEKNLQLWRFRQKTQKNDTKGKDW